VGVGTKKSEPILPERRSSMQKSSAKSKAAREEGGEDGKTLLTCPMQDVNLAGLSGLVMGCSWTDLRAQRSSTRRQIPPPLEQMQGTRSTPISTQKTSKELRTQRETGAKRTKPGKSQLPKHTSTVQSGQCNQRTGKRGEKGRNRRGATFCLG